MSAETTPDIHSTAVRAEVLRSRRSEAAGKRQAAVDKQHAKGKMTAMERIEAFLDPDSFQAIDGLTRHRSHNFGLEKTRPYGDSRWRRNWYAPGLDVPHTRSASRASNRWSQRLQ